MKCCQLVLPVSLLGDQCRGKLCFALRSYIQRLCHVAFDMAFQGIIVLTPIDEGAFVPLSALLYSVPCISTNKMMELEPELELGVWS